MTLWAGIGLLSLAVWLYLLVARGGYWLARERDDGALGCAVALACRRGGRSRPQRGRRDRAIHRQPARPGLCRAVARRAGRRWQQRRHGRRCPASQRPSTAQRRLDVACRDGFARGLDGQAVGAGAGHSACHGRGRCRRLFPADRCRHRPCAPTTSASWLRAPSSDGRVQVSLMAELSCTSAGRAFPSFPPSSISSRCSIPSAGSRGAIARRPPPPAAARWCAAMRWSGLVASPPSGPRSSTIARWRVASRPRADLARPDAACRELAALRRLPGRSAA